MFAEPFHEGERSIQQRAGSTTLADRNSVMIQNRILSGALPFLREQFIAVIGSEDQSGKLWCSLVFGKPGFLHSEDGKTVAIDLCQAVRNEADPLYANLAVGGRAGMLAIDLASRRRLRVNGVMSRPNPDSLLLEVTESYPNCPKYITRRLLSTATLRASKAAVTRGTALAANQEATVQRADLLFIASAHAAKGLDASHRGGYPGFVELLDSRTLRIPDYSGNSMFNTLGNLQTNPRAGLAIPDFRRGQLLQLTGDVEIAWKEPERSLVFHIGNWIDLPLPDGLQEKTLDYSPFNPER